jgi:hypothetical protein
MPHERPGLAVQYGHALRLVVLVSRRGTSSELTHAQIVQDEDQDDENRNVPRSCCHPGTTPITDDRKRKPPLRAEVKCRQLPSNHTRGGSASQ